MTWSDGLQAGTTAFEIAASTNRHIRVVAGPGTGKSFAMKRRVARLLEEGVEPTTILPVTFTRVAAEDLHRELVGMRVPGCEQIVGTTLHSLAMRILMRRNVLAATGRTPRALNDFEIKPLEADLAGQFNGVRAFRRKLKAFESAWARLQRDEPGFVQTPDDAAFEGVVGDWLLFHRAMLIGEVIPQLHSYLSSNPAASERAEFSHVLVDEYQDLNRAEQAVIELLSDTADICVVGDDDQSIYSFKYAHPEGIRDWLVGKQNGDDVTLADCRRCPTQVVAMANALISRNVNRPIPRTLTALPENGVGDVKIAQFPTLDEELIGVVQYIADLVRGGTPPGDILVLAQRGVIGTPIYEGLILQGVPVRSYYAEAELDAEDAQIRFALLKLFVDREDRVALRWLLGRGSGSWLSGNYARLRRHCEKSGQSPWQALEQLESGAQTLAHTGPLVARFRSLVTEIAQLESLCAAADLQAAIDHLFPEASDEVREIRALALLALGVAGNDRELFLQELSSSIAKPEVPSEVHEVRVMSLHKSKGLSSPVTIIAGCVEGLLPKQPDQTLPPQQIAADLEEQRRLFYVGISRVKATPTEGKPGRLILTYSLQMPLRTAKGSGIEPAQTDYGNARMLASRFIREMGPSAPAPQAGL